MSDSRTPDVADPPRTVVPVPVPERTLSASQPRPTGAGTQSPPSEGGRTPDRDHEIAVGAVMECLGVEADVARSVLDTCSQTHGVPVRTLSRWVVQDLAGVTTAHSHVVAAFLSDPFRAGPRTGRPTFRIVDVDGNVLYRPTDDACELVRQVASTAGEALVQVQDHDGTWTDGRGRGAGLLGLVTTEPTVVEKVDAAALVDPVVSTDGAVWRMALLDVEGLPLVEGTLPPRDETAPDVRLAERVLRGLGLAPAGGWVAPPVDERPFYVARVKAPRFLTTDA